MKKLIKNISTEIPVYLYRDMTEPHDLSVSMYLCVNNKLINLYHYFTHQCFAAEQILNLEPAEFTCLKKVLLQPSQELLFAKTIDSISNNGNYVFDIDYLTRAKQSWQGDLYKFLEDCLNMSGFLTEYESHLIQSFLKISR